MNTSLEGLTVVSNRELCILFAKLDKQTFHTTLRNSKPRELEAHSKFFDISCDLIRASNLARNIVNLEITFNVKYSSDFNLCKFSKCLKVFCCKLDKLKTSAWYGERIRHKMQKFYGLGRLAELCPPVSELSMRSIQEIPEYYCFARALSKRKKLTEAAFYGAENTNNPVTTKFLATGLIRSSNLSMVSLAKGPLNHNLISWFKECLALSGVTLRLS